MKTRTRIASVLAAAGLAVGLSSAPAWANSSYGCSTLSGHLHATSTLINYGSARGTAIYTSATGYYHQDVTFGVDKNWKFLRMTLVNANTKTTNPSQWGSYSNPLNFSTKYVRVTWIGRDSLAQYYPNDPLYTSCTVKVGV